jgi:MoaA/NifB/PqqE/SkfB family radical SAM enzyme
MESIYYVAAWACHRRCRHCYEGRFRPYVRDDLEAVVREAERNAPRIVDHFPERMTFRDRRDPGPDGKLPERVGRVILSGGEFLLEALRERVSYPLIERIRRRYRDAGGVRIVVQTTGDLLDDAIVDALLERGVWMISVASVDDFHVGLEGEAKQRAFVERLRRMFERHGMKPAEGSIVTRKEAEEAGPVFGFFGARPDSWIGKLWPRGRAWENGLSAATLADNFCSRWSGGLGFLEHGVDGSEVSVEPDGSVYPCCIKTKLPIGNLVEERLIDILDSLRGDPVYEAINRGEPQSMGLADGWDEAQFVARSRAITPQGRSYENLCIGCDRFHEEVLAPRLAAARERRRRARVAAE